MQDPERYLKQQQIVVRDPIHPERPAVVDSSLRARVNHEIYFFSDREALDRFRRDPLRYCGVLTDPVNRVRFRPHRRSPRWDYHGQPFYFANSLTYRTFKAIPDSFAVRKGG